MTQYFDIISQSDQSIQIRLKGAWVIENLKTIEKELQSVFERPVGLIEADLSKLEALDIACGHRLHVLSQAQEKTSGEFAVFAASPKHQVTLEICAAHEKEPPAEPPSGILASLAKLKRHFMAMTETIGRDFLEVLTYFGFFIATCLSWSSLRHVRMTSVMHHLDSAGFRSIPVIALISFLMGAIFAQQGIFHARPYGAEFFIGPMIALFSLRELGLVIAAIIAAGRTASAYSAEIGAMRMREEIDAMRVMGINPQLTIIFPRLLALTLALPVLTLVANAALIGGTLLVVTTYGGISSQSAIEQMMLYTSNSSAWLGVAKAPIIGLIVATIGCIEGSRVSSSTESLGRHTTIAVVKSTFAIIATDSLFAILFSQIEI